MPIDARVNFAYGTVATAPSPATSGTSLVVTSGHGARFPAAPFNAVVWPANQLPLSSNAEIVRVTAKSTDTLTITRTQEGTSARSIQVGDQIMAGPTKKTFDDIEADIAAVLPSQTSNARKFLTTNGSSVSWAFSKGNLSTWLVAANDASAADKAIADYVCDGTADEVQIQDAIDAAKLNNGGTVLLSEGNYAISSGLYIAGDGDEGSPTISLRGQGVDTTYLNCASNVDAITLQDIPKVHISDMRIGLSGTGRGIRSISGGSPLYRSFWQSSFKNLYFFGDFSTHSGWAMYMENPFRSTFENIEGNGLGNGVYLSATDAAFNPGNLVFIRCFMDLSQPNGTAWKLFSEDGGGQFNICTFIQCEASESEATSTTSIGWHLRGSSTSYHTTKNIYILSSNVESFNTAVKLEKAIQNTLQFNFLSAKDGGKLIDFDSNSNGNDITILSGYLPASHTVSLVTDANTNANAPNVIRRFEAYLDTGSTLSATVTSATQFDRINTSGPGTLDSDIPNGKTTFAEHIRVPDDAYSSGWSGSREVPNKDAIYDLAESLKPSFAREFALMGS